MNREIKFRVWDGQQMEYNIMAGSLGVFYVKGIDEKDSVSMSPFNTKYPDYIPLMQYTGLKDKNGIEIYEGDILKLDDPNWGYGGMYDKEHDGYLYREVAFEDGCFCFKNGSELYNVNRQSEVIGNVYANPKIV